MLPVAPHTHTTPTRYFWLVGGNPSPPLIHTRTRHSSATCAFLFEGVGEGDKKPPYSPPLGLFFFVRVCLFFFSFLFSFIFPLCFTLSCIPTERLEVPRVFNYVWIIHMLSRLSNGPLFLPLLLHSSIQVLLTWFFIWKHAHRLST